MDKESLHDHITKLCEKSYQDGSKNMCDALKKSFRSMDHSGMKKHTTAQILDFIELAEKII